MNDLKQYKPQTQRRLARILAQCKQAANSKPEMAYVKTGKGKDGFNSRRVNTRGKTHQIKRMPVTGSYM